VKKSNAGNVAKRLTSRWQFIVAIVAMFGAAVLVAPLPAVASSAQAARTAYYLSLGDSLAVGHQPGTSDGSETLHGYSNRVVTDLSSKVPLTLENFGCGGATTSSILTGVGCSDEQALNAVQYPTTTQVGAAVSFMKTHPGQVKLITISIGGNDYANCVISLAPPASCVAALLPSMKTNIESLVSQLRAAGGPSVIILGLTDYLDALAYWVDGSAGKTSAKDWITEFRSVLVPALSHDFASAKGTLVNIIADSGSYVPLTKLVNYPPYGKIPVAVARNCSLVWMCRTQNGDAHPTSAGYALMAKEIASAYLRATG
jgi:lysophospholipase L1-like esterase